MKALTVQQPWAWAIVHGGKDVENRTQAWSYRGPLAIHAGKRLSQRGMDSPVLQSAWAAAGEPPIMNSEAGAIIGLVDMVAVHLPDQSLPCCTSLWAEMQAGVHLVLENPRPLRRPIPARGRLGLWDLDGEQLAELVGSGVLSGMECV